jgi:uncharacterized protein YbjT (DUF2867 family)
MILVAGPTNELGCEICYILASQGKSIRALVLDTSDLAWVERLKNFGAILAAGDLYDPVFLADAYVGVDAVICSPLALPYNDQPGENRFRNFELAGVLALMDAAKAADVSRFVYLSFSNQAEPGMPSGKGKQRIEQRLMESGLPYTIFHTGDYPAEAQTVSRVSPRDLARLATQALENPALRNSVVELGMQAPPGSNQKKTPAVSSRSRARLILLDKDV